MALGRLIGLVQLRFVLMISVWWLDLQQRPVVATPISMVPGDTRVGPARLVNRVAAAMET